VSRPGLFERLAASARVTVVSAGSGKTVLLRSWIDQAGLEDSAAWVPVVPGEGDSQRFWLSVLAALRRTSAGSALVQPVTAAPDLDGWAISERLLKDLAPLADRTWLVLDDVHELGSDEARRQLELLVMRAPDALRQPNFTWAEHGEALLRRRKPWYYEHEPRPDISVLGARLSELLRQ
jgi:LuxR family maltose regulon positive regulatory protein